ncbi:phage head closure protein [Virgibacillus salexigens]|uniref:phage head closure protein n=1 Tax=Virgibacillus salexigens TaxID=61016 RepID=UPI003081BA7F
MATYDHEVTLINKTIDYDDLGNPIPSETKTTVLCQLGSIGRSEFYEASAQGLKPEIEFVIHAFEYSGESEIEFQGVLYTVIRTFRRDFEEIELTCERNIGQ